MPDAPPCVKCGREREQEESQVMAKQVHLSATVQLKES